MNELLTQLIECNQWRFIGRLGADPEMRFLESGLSVCNARLLVNKPGQKRDDGQKPHGFKLTIWEQKAQAFADAVKKGDLVDVTGRVKSETWNDRTTGEQRTGVVMNVETFEVLAKPGQPQQSAAQSGPGGSPAPAKAAPQPAWNSGPISDEEVPF
jgi:single-strand DNA-binding protein